MAYIDTWLVLGPIFNPAQQTPTHAPGDGHPVAADILADIDKAAGLDPAGMTTPSGSGPAEGDTFVYTSPLYPGIATRWQSLGFQDTAWDNPADIGDNIHQKLAAAGFAYRHHALAFFLVYVTAPAELTTSLLVRSDDGIRVWLNGDEVKELAFMGDRDLPLTESSAPVKLLKGENRLLCAVAETHVEWAFSARFSDDADLSFATARGIAEPLPSGTAVINLEELSDRYAVFEADQVLTHLQLNSVAQWFEDQGRLSRLLLSGAGIGCGLRASLVNGLVTVTRGFGLTTDGDLLYLPAATTCDRFRPFDRSRPVYPPFTALRNADGSYRIAELLAVGEKGHADAAGLADFTAGTGQQLSEMVVVFYMENYVTDSDICSVTGCDNLGKQCRNRPTLLLVHRSDLPQLQSGAPATWDDLYAHTTQVAIPRPRFVGARQATELIAAYGDACSQLMEGLGKGITSLGSALWRLLLDDPAAAPLAQYRDRVQKLLGKFLSSATGGELKMHKSVIVAIQYFYDFLKDLAETFNDLREELCCDRSVCVPDPELFPKHLVLGELSGSLAARTGFYPSPLLGDRHHRLEHARFLARKLVTLVDAFTLQEPGGIVITPSHGEERPLEERAVPFYYDEAILGDLWSFREAHTRSRLTSPDELAIKILKRQRSPRISHYSFFRVQGHLGEDVQEALQALHDEIAAQGVPVAVTAVQLADAVSDPVHPTRYADLHRVYDALRRTIYDNLSGALEDLKKAGDTLKSLKSAQVEILQRLVTATAASAEALRKKLAGTYSAHRQAGAWQPDMEQLLKDGQPLLRYVTLLASRQYFPASLEALLSGRELHLLDRLGRHLDQKTEQEDNRLLFRTFLSEHPGLDHLAGAPRGGTLVLVYDADRTVVADFMLPYRLSVPVGQESPWLEWTVLPILLVGEPLFTLFTMTATETAQQAGGGTAVYIGMIRNQRDDILRIREEAKAATEADRAALLAQAAEKEQTLADEMARAVEYLAVSQPSTEETGSLMMTVLTGMDAIESKETLTATTARMQEMGVMTQNASLKQSLNVLMPSFNARIHP